MKVSNRSIWVSLTEGSDGLTTLNWNADSGIESLFQTTYDSIQAGGSGVAYGRNIFQSQNPRTLVEALVKILHKNWEVSEVMKEYKDKL